MNDGAIGVLTLLHPDERQRQNSPSAKQANPEVVVLRGRIFTGISTLFNHFGSPEHDLPAAADEAHAQELAVLYFPLEWGALTVLYQLGQACGWSDVLNRTGWILCHALDLAERQDEQVAA